MRGLAYLEVNLIGPDKDLHSGHYGERSPIRSRPFAI